MKAKNEAQCSVILLFFIIKILLSFFLASYI